MQHVCKPGSALKPCPMLAPDQQLPNHHSVLHLNLAGKRLLPTQGSTLAIKSASTARALPSREKVLQNLKVNLSTS